LIPRSVGKAGVKEVDAMQAFLLIGWVVLIAVSLKGAEMALRKLGEL